jgi:lysophospholipase L1-like esterase
MDPQPTGWPLTPAERAYVLLNASRRRPVTESGAVLPAMEPVTPTAGYWPSYPGDTNDGDTRWLDAHARLVDLARRQDGPVDLVLLGDGLIQGWGGGWNGSPWRRQWQEFFPDYRAVNLGLTGDRIEHLLWRLEHGALDHLDAAVVVVLAGSANQPSATNAAWLAAGLALVVRSIRLRLPKAQVVLIKPLPGRDLSIRPLHAQLDALGLAQDDRVHLLDFADDLRNIDDSIKGLGFAPDGIHLDDVGYEIAATRLRTLLRRLVGRSGGGRWEDPPRTRLRLIHEHPAALIHAGHPDARGNVYGLEGGSVLKVGGLYHLFSAENHGEPRWNAMRLAHWTSADRLTWQRRPTLYESSNDLVGNDPRAALWAPMPIYNQDEGRWNLFYVAYRTIAHPQGLAGRIWRAVSTVPGPEGLNGPWQDVGVILQPDAESQPWEGTQGVDSFFPYQVAPGRWLGFYGSSDARTWFRVGLAESPSLAGPWRRRPSGNPVALCGPRGAENPVVTRLPSGRYIAVFESVFNEIGFAYADSADGLVWSEAHELEVSASNHSLRKVRTPLGLIAEDDGTYSLFYTGFSKADSRWGEVWYTRIQVEAL